MRHPLASRRAQLTAAVAAAVLLGGVVTAIVRSDGPAADRLAVRALPTESPTLGASSGPPAASATAAPASTAAATPTTSVAGGTRPTPHASENTPSPAPEPLDGNVADVKLSGNGRFLAFTAASDQIVPGDTNHAYDVFVRELATGRTVRASVDDAGHQLPHGVKHAVGISLSADASRVLFNDSEGRLLVRDLAAGRTLLVGHTATAGSGSLSADGGFVGFASREDDIVAGDTNGEADAFVAELSTGKVTRVSVASDGSQGHAPSKAGPQGQTWTHFVQVSRGGSSVAFVSELSGLVAGDIDAERRSYLYLHDLASGATSRLDSAREARMTPDARWIVYRGGAAGGTPVWDTRSGRSEKVSANDTVEAGYVKLSADGRFVLDVDQSYRLRVLDRSTGGSSLAGRGDMIGETGISDDGRKVAFVTSAPNRRYVVAMLCTLGKSCVVASDA